jgi:DNA helicase-2/ATP-dependent DNA helicase PcrA
MRPIDFEAELNAEQFRAATGPDGPLLILAAAGTGKTRTLVYRVAYLVHKGIDPERILLLTFTNKAAKEMITRATELVGAEARVRWNGTFHHVANRILRRHATHIGYRNDFTIMDRDDSKTVMGSCLKELKLGGKEFPKKEVLLGLVSHAANTETAFADVVEQRFGDFDDVAPGKVVQVLERFCERKRELDAMDFDDLLVQCLHLLRTNERLRESYQEQFQHVLVDEYQDTNTIQAQLVDLLSGRHGNLFVVGDDFQSIYSWRGADYRNIITFAERYKDAQIFKLETNYRSVPEVLAVANTVVTNSSHPEAFHKEMRATRGGYHRPRIARLRDGEHQARYVVEQVKAFRREGYRYSDMAILYRAHYHALELQLALSRAHTPHVITSGMRFFEQAHVKDVLCFMRMLTSHEDELAFVRFLTLLPGVGPMTAEKLWKKLGGSFESFNPLHRQIMDAAMPKRARERWLLVAPLLAAFHDEGLKQDICTLISRLIECFYAQYAVDTYDNYEDRLDDLRELGLHALKFESINEFLNDVALLTNLDAEVDEALEIGGNGDAVKLGTIHQAKGLEYPVVILIWLTQGMFPSSRSMSESDEGTAEERRLFYVAATRAEDELLMCVPKIRRMRDGGVMYCDPSEFVSDIPPELVDDARVGFM